MRKTAVVCLIRNIGISQLAAMENQIIRGLHLKTDAGCTDQFRLIVTALKC